MVAGGQRHELYPCIPEYYGARLTDMFSDQLASDDATTAEVPQKSIPALSRETYLRFCVAPSKHIVGRVLDRTHFNLHVTIPGGGCQDSSRDFVANVRDPIV